MLQQARQQSRWLRRFERVRADAYALPFADGAFDLVFSSLMLQWCDDLDAVFGEIARVLKPGGLLLFSTFGPGTLAELREAWAAAGDASNHVNHFFDPHALGTALMQATLAEPATDRNGNGVIEMSELVEHVSADVVRVSKGMQTPWVPRHELFGDLGLADRPR
jgi:malonyl-CoA O-methyltransferase